MEHLTLQKMCPEVFLLDKEEFRILKYLALHGPMNSSQIARHTTKYAMSLDRWAVKKRLEGTSRFLGLIPNDYVIEEETGKHRYNKQEKRYWLTIKGIIASAAIVPLEKNSLFEHYVWGIAKKVENKNIEKFANDTIQEFIRLIVAWHYLQGIQLTKQKSSKFYYLEILEHIKSVNAIDITITDKEIDAEFIQIVKNCIANYTVIDLLTSGGLRVWDSTLTVVDWGKSEKIENQSTYNWYSKIWEWSLHLGDPQFHAPDEIGKLTKMNTIRTSVSVDETYSIDINDNVNSILKNIKYKSKWKSKI